MTIAVGAVVVLGIGVAVWIVLLRRYGGAGATVELDAIRTAGTLLLGTGGATALLLAARRQRATELTLLHTDRDATERRITELYTKAADQLGSDQAPVRLAGLYALERLANSTAEHRQTIVNVICAYLRMPYTPPPERPSPRNGIYRSPGPRKRRPRSLTDRPTAASTPRYQQAQEERQVRLTAQDILSRNLRVPPVAQRRWWQWRQAHEAAPPWPGIHLDLTGALLIDFTLQNCRLDQADFSGAQFTSNANFSSAQFTSNANFSSAQFTSDANFRGIQFTSYAYFSSAQFTSYAYFSSAQFTSDANFSGTHFTRNANFSGAQFTSDANFRGAQFTSNAYFSGTHFTSNANFSGAQFTSDANFSGTHFTSNANFSGAQFTSDANFSGTQFTSIADFHGAQFTSYANFSRAQFTRNTDFDGVRVLLGARAYLPGWSMRPAQPDAGEDLDYQYLVRIENVAAEEA